MDKLKRILTLAMLTAAPMSGFGANCPTNPEVWTGAMSGDWNNALNWNPNTCIPGSGAITNTDGASFGASANFTISLDNSGGISPGLGRLIFDSSESYTLNATTHVIQFNGAVSSLQDQAGNHTINVPIQLEDTAFAVDVTSGSLTLTKGISEAAGSTSQMSLSGPGQLINVSSTISINGDLGDISGVLINTNSVAQAGTTGSKIFAGDIIVSTLGSVSNLNSGNITAGGTGSVMQALSTSVTTFGNFNVAGGSVTSLNSGSVSGSSTGVEILAGNNLQIGSGAVLNNINSGPVTTTSKGAFIDVTNNVTVNGGTLRNTNSGSITGAGSVGSEISATNFIIISGLVQNFNTGPTASGGIGSVLLATNQFNINGGTVVNNAVIQSTQVVIGSAGTLSGAGLYQDAAGGSTTHINNNGKVIVGGTTAGGSGGVMTIQGSYQQQPGGILVAKVSNPANSSELDITGPSGTANIAGTLQVAITKGATLNLGQPFPIVVAQQGVTGTFAHVTSLTEGFLPLVKYTGDEVLLTIIPPSMPANYPGAHIVPKILIAAHNNLDADTLCHLRGVHRRLSQYQVAEKAKVSLDKVQASLPDRSSDFLAANDIRMDDPMLFASSSKQPKSDLASILIVPQQRQQLLLHRISGAPPAAPFYPGSFFFGPQGAVGEAEGSSYWMAGAQGGTDYAFVESGVGIGAIVSYEHTAGSGFKIDEAAMNLYSTYAPVPCPSLAFNAIIGGAYDWYHYDTKMGFGTPEFVGKGSPRGTEFNALFGLEYILNHSQIDAFPEPLQVCPQVSIQYERVFQGKYTQHGLGELDFKLGNLATKSLRTTLGVAVFYQWTWENVSLLQEIQVAWQREFLMKKEFMSTSLADFKGVSGTILASKTGRNIAQGALDLMVLFFNKYGVEANYSYEWNSTYITHNFYLNAIYNF